MNTNKTLQAIDLSCVRQTKPLFSDVSFTLTANELLLVEGANGVGKSSLLRLLCGIATPSAGTILWENHPIDQLRTDYWENVHYIGHSNGIKLGLTVSENLRFTSHLFLQYGADESVLSLFQLLAYKDTPVKFLSAGQKRRVALAKLLLFPKTLWILDEPLTALDTYTHHLFLDCLTSHLTKGGLAIVSSHHHIELKNVIIKTLRLSLC